MPRPHPPEFRRRAVELARLREKPVAEIARDLGISDSCLRNWMAQADVDDALDNAVAESFFASLQCELLDRRPWPTRAGVARAMFHWIEGLYNPTRRHSTLGYLSPIDFEATTVA